MAATLRLCFSGWIVPHTLCQHWRSNYLARGAVSCSKDVLRNASRSPNESLECFHPSNEISRLADVPGRSTSCATALRSQRRLPQSHAARRQREAMCVRPRNSRSVRCSTTRSSPFGFLSHKGALHVSQSVVDML